MGCPSTDWLENNGLKLAGPLIRTRLEPFGETALFPIRTPDGAWLEFYQQPTC